MKGLGKGRSAESNVFNRTGYSYACILLVIDYEHTLSEFIIRA